MRKNIITHQLLRAEMHREIKEIEQCIKILETLKMKDKYTADITKW